MMGDPRRLLRDARNLYAYFRAAEYPNSRGLSMWMALKSAVRGPW